MMITLFVLFVLNELVLVSMHNIDWCL